MEKYDKELSERYKRFRNQARVTQTEIAKRLRVSQSTVSRWDNGYVVPDEYINEVSKMFNVDPTTLTKVSDEREDIERDILAAIRRLPIDDLRILRTVAERMAR